MAIVTTAPESVGPGQGTWQQEMKNAIRNPFELCRELKLPRKLALNALAGAEQFPLFAPRPFVSRIVKGDDRDPLLLQLLPRPQETKVVRAYSADPVGDQASLMAPGIIQKYPGRVLLLATGACAIHCRYCFRRHFPYHDLPGGSPQWNRSLRELDQDRSIDEVILSGGDPLVLNDLRLAELVQQIESIDHVMRLRIHTRLPIMIPARIGDAFLDLLRRSRLTVVVVIHCNHPREIDAQVEWAIARLVQAGIPVLNQAVLLRGINDHLEAQIALSRTLVNNRVMPYYLNLLDRVQGAAHFEVARAAGERLIEGMRQALPGYAIPRLVSDEMGGPSKTHWK